MWRKTAICSRDELQESEDLCLTDGNAASKYAGWLIKSYSCKSKVCAKTIVIVEDLCLTDGNAQKTIRAKHRACSKIVTI